MFFSILSLLPALAQDAQPCVSYSFTLVENCVKHGVGSRFLFDDNTFHPHLRDPTGYVQGSCENAERPMIDRFLDVQKSSVLKTDFTWGTCDNVRTSGTPEYIEMTCQDETSYEALQKCGYATPNVPAPIILDETHDGHDVKLPACSIISLYKIFGKDLFELLTEVGRYRHLTPIEESVWEKDLQCEFLGIDMMHEWMTLHSTRLTVGIDDPHPIHENSGTHPARRRLQSSEDQHERRRDGRKTTGPRAITLWPNGVVPYVIEAAVGQTYDSVGSEGDGVSEQAGQHDYLSPAFHTRIVNSINEAIADFNKYTCIQIKPRTTETDYIAIVWKEGCWSNSLGVRGGRQLISLGRGCFYKSIAIHEFMHAIGFEHEHKRPDRDSYLNINLAHAEPGYRSQFTMIDEAVWDPRGVGYDISSIMAYGAYDFTGDVHDAVITEMTDHQKALITGQRVTMSIFDAEQVKRMYEPQCGTRQPAPIVGFERFKQTTSCGAKMAADLSATTDRSYGKPVKGVHSRAECALATLKAEECYSGVFQWNNANYLKWGGCKTQYLGCYANPASNHMMTHRVLLGSDGSNQAKCRDKCHEDGYRYFGRQNHGECWCGNGYGPRQGGAYVQHTDSSCNCESVDQGLGQRAGHNGATGAANANGQCYGAGSNMAVYDVCARTDSARVTDADIAGQMTEQTCGCCHSHFGYDGDHSAGWELSFLTGSGLNQYALNNPYPKPSLVTKVKTTCSEATVMFDDMRDWKRCEATCHHYYTNFPQKYSDKFSWSPTLSSQRYSGLWGTTGNAGVGCQCCKVGSPEVASTHQILYQLNPAMYNAGQLKPEFAGTFVSPWAPWDWGNILQNYGRRRLNNGTEPVHPDDLPDAPQNNPLDTILAQHEAELKQMQTEIQRANMASLVNSLTNHVIPVVEAEQQCEEDLKARRTEVSELLDDARHVSDVEKLGSYSAMITLALISVVGFTYVLWRAFCRRVLAVDQTLPKFENKGWVDPESPKKMASTAM